MVSYIFYFATEPKKELVNFNLLTQERVGLNKPKRLYLLKPNYDMEVSRTKELPNSQSNDTDLNNTDNIETDNNDALKFQVLEELPQQLQDYLSKFEIREIRIIKSVLLKGKKSFNNAHYTYYRLEDVEFEIVSVLKRFKAMLLQKNETVETMQGYLMQSIKAELEETHALYMRRQNMSKYNVFNQ
ncbi:RepA-like protein [Staphylococcus capitis]|uniref:hypothetical protein n=1 Tax=Streptomyces flavochromogenes TaxID=68199 RepID=UPI0036DA26B4